MSKDEIATRVQRVADLLHIERLLKRRPGQLSGGEQQRVALARALVREPRAFLMDEPLTNLDLKLRVEMRTELTRIHRSLGGTFLYVTNDQVEAMSMADRVAVLRDGKVQQTGAPRDVYERPVNSWVASFVGSPRISLLPCRAEGDRLVGESGWSLPRPGWASVNGGRPLLLGVRAEDLSLERRDGSASLEGSLYAIEPLGDRTLVDMRVGDAVVKVKARPRPRPATSARRSQPRSTSTGFTSSTPTRARLSDDDAHCAAGARERPAPVRGHVRRAQILERIQTVGGASLAELARDYAVSTITVHRDLNHLAREGLVERFHGGARAISGARRAGRRPHGSGASARSGPAKDAIAAYARA